LLKNILAYCGYSSTSPVFLLLSEHKHCDNAATNSNSENARSRIVASLRGSVGTGTKRKYSQILGAFGLLDFTMLRPVLACGARFETYESFISLIFKIFFFGPRILNPRIRRVHLYCIFLKRDTTELALRRLLKHPTYNFLHPTVSGIRNNVCVCVCVCVCG
jgi:hypothetical protein